MGAIIALLGRMLVWLVSTYAGQWIIKALFSLGIGVVTHKVATPALMSFLQSQAAGMGQFMFQTLGAIGGDVGFSMIISATVSATTGRMVIRALQR